MSPLDEYLKECDRSCLVNIGEDCNCGRDSAIQELADLRSEKSRLAQENIRLNNNEDFLDSRIAELEKAVEEAEEVIEEYVTQEGATASAELWRLKKYGKEQK